MQILIGRLALGLVEILKCQAVTRQNLVSLLHHALEKPCCNVRMILFHAINLVERQQKVLADGYTVNVVDPLSHVLFAVCCCCDVQTRLLIHEKLCMVDDNVLNSKELKISIFLVFVLFRLQKQLWVDKGERLLTVGHQECTPSACLIPKELACVALLVSKLL
jgi:hypothetical protein